MRALLALALVTTATAAHAGVLRDSVLRARLYVDALEDPEACLVMLDAARVQGIADTTRFRIRGSAYERVWIRRNGRTRYERVVHDYSLDELRGVCAARARRHAADSMRVRIWNASRYPVVWVEPCREYWPKALALGVDPSDSYRGGLFGESVPEDLDLETAYYRYCTPNR